MTKQLSYNLPGFGFANCVLFSEAEDLYCLLEKKSILEKAKNTYQLGTMRFVYPGAHHTRYEYIFTQLMLISSVVTTKREKRKVDISLGSSLKEYKPFNYSVSGGTVMQMLAMLSNMGHMYDTFTASRILLRLLQDSKNNRTQFYSVYRRNLPNEIHDAFDVLMTTENFYKLHLFNAIHILKGFANTSANSNLCALCIKLLCQLIDPKLISNESTSRIFMLYKKIRKIAYLSVDMIYTPASFGANLSQMIYTISSAVDDLFNEQSPINRSISQLEDIIHRQIYDSPLCILNSTRIEQDQYPKYSALISKISNIHEIRTLLLELEEPYDTLYCKVQPTSLKKLHSDYTLLLSGDGIRKHTDKLLDFDKQMMESIPATRIAFGTQLAQNLACIYSAFGILSHMHIPEDCQKVISKAIAKNMYNQAEKIELVHYAINSLYKPGEFYFTLSAPSEVAINDCVFIGCGCKNVAKTIRNYFSPINISNPDKYHEIMSCATVLDGLSYSGLVLCFVGGIKASRYSKSEKTDELDGLIYFPNKDPKNKFAIIVEAKNRPYGETLAEKQLKDTQEYLADACSFEIIKKDRFAYMELSLN